MLDELYHALDPVAFSIGPFEVRWYALGYIIGIVVGALIAYRTAKHWKIHFTLDNLLTLMIGATLGIILGARLGYILFYNLEYYLAHPLEIFTTSVAGMSFHGGVIGLVIAGLICARIMRMPFLTIADLIVVAAPVGIFLVRIANFINGELWGAPTDAAWGVVFDAAGPEARHPTQLYEAFLEGAVMFVVLFIRARRLPPRPRGSFLGLFLLLYGIFRIAIEFVREPDAHIGYLLGTGWLTMGMVLSIPLVIVGVLLLLVARSRRLPQKGSSSKA